MNSDDIIKGVFYLFSADVVFNGGKLTGKLIDCFSEILTAHYTKDKMTYVVTQQELIDAGFGC